MSTSHNTTQRADDRLVTAISGWLAGHVSNQELRQELERVRRGELADDQVEALDELRAELAETDRRGELEMTARETLQALAFGG
jgi:DNA-binding IclR family transcriptional regulator